jgi:hypothetical protein
MGCDMHAHIEVKMEGKWRHYSAPSINRNYDFFALIAGVRNYDNIKPISKPKGIPKDVTYITKKHYESWGLDAHDASWLGVEELIELENIKHDEVFFLEDTFKTFIFGNRLTGWYKYPEDNKIGIEDLRIVFWFDN